MFHHYLKSLLAPICIFSMMSFSITESVAQSIIMGTAQFTGTGCNNQNANATLSADGRIISLIFDDYVVNAKGEATPMMQKNCLIQIPIQAPPGYSVSLFSIDYRGFVGVTQGGKIAISADYSFAGQTSRRYSKSFVGPKNENYIFRNELRADINTGSSCGGSTILRSQSNLTAEVQSNAEATATIDTIDIQSAVVYYFELTPCQGLPQAPPVPAPVTGNPSNYIHGYIDNFSERPDGGFDLQGWACARGIEESIALHVYLNGPAGKGKFVKAAVAQNANEQAVSNECQTQSTAHRFSIPFSREEVLIFNNMSVHVHGISPVGLANSTIQRSGSIRFPRTTQTIFGNSTFNTQSEGEGQVSGLISGFACNTSSQAPLDLEIFVGGPIGEGKFFATAKANIQLDEYRIGQCTPQYGNFGYNVYVPRELHYEAATGLYVYAVDPDTGALFLLDGGH